MWSPLGLLLLIIPLIIFAMSYIYHSRFISDTIFQLSQSERTPAHDPLNEGDNDYSPATDRVLWGHHFSSIAGAAPIVGPSIAVFYGWLPALLWIVFGTVLIGTVHDMGALVISARNGGHTVGDLSGKIISRRARVLFLLITYFLCWIIIATFARIIASLFSTFPASVIPVNIEILLAFALGYVIQRQKLKKMVIISISFLICLYIFVWVGAYVEYTADEPVVKMKGVSHTAELDIWVVLLLIYAYFASILPVSVLLRPRDVLNAHQLAVGLFLISIGLAVTGPSVNAPAVNTYSDPNVPPVFPFLFTTIACGAVSGFHGLVGSATTSKQLDSMQSARPVGYAGMLGEGVQATMAVIACVCGVTFETHYGSWTQAAKSGTANFVNGSATFIEALFIPRWLGEPLVAVIVVSFAATSLDTAMRIQRTIVNEFGSGMLKYGSEYRQVPYWVGRGMSNKYIGGLLAVLPAMWLSFGDSLADLWALFGSTNQLVAAITLTVVVVEMYREGVTWKHLLLIGLASAPFMFVVCSTTLVLEITRWVTHPDILGHLLSIIVGVLIFCMIMWLVWEVVLLVMVFVRVSKQKGGESVRGRGIRLADKYRRSGSESGLIEAEVGML